MAYGGSLRVKLSTIDPWSQLAEGHRDLCY